MQPSRFGDDEDDDEIAAFLKHKAQRAVDAAKAPNAAFSGVYRSHVRQRLHVATATRYDHNAWVTSHRRPCVLSSLVSVKYDEHNNPIVEKKEIEPLPLVDHSSVKYESFKRSFYREAAAIAALSGSEVTCAACSTVK